MRAGVHVGLVRPSMHDYHAGLLSFAGKDILVLMGDCNKWWCVHAGEHASEIHQMWPAPVLPSVPDQPSSSHEKKATLAGLDNNVGFVKQILTKARDDLLAARDDLLAASAGEAPMLPVLIAVSA